MSYQLPTNPDSITIAGHTVALGGSQNLAASDLTNGTIGSGDVVLANGPALTGNLSILMSGTARLISQTMIGNGNITNASVNIDISAGSSTQGEAAMMLGVTANAGTPGSNSYKNGLYIGADAQSGAGAIEAANFLVTLENGVSPGVFANVLELDFNNNSGVDYGNTGETGGDPGFGIYTASAVHGCLVTGAGGNLAVSAFCADGPVPVSSTTVNGSVLGSTVPVANTGIFAIGRAVHIMAGSATAKLGGTSYDGTVTGINSGASTITVSPAPSGVGTGDWVICGTVIWQHGFRVNRGVYRGGFIDASNNERSIYITNNHDVGIDVSTMGGLHEAVANVFRMGQNQIISVKNNVSGTPDIAAFWVNNNNLEISAGGAYGYAGLTNVYCGAPATFYAGITVGTAILISSSVNLTNGAASNTATLTNAPASGNPTKWIPINDNGTTRYIPVW